ncbi:hypothetical protein IFR04_004878 [Cadophora malorum]|uniref:Uncharacterized protein n=1 Tax=Cadophora malorum TaxID=108018 RepID=A0A8H8BRV8_9HELO|nr:hypothetical protein IFR04_004878 [Cadophora malorum]
MSDGRNCRAGSRCHARGRRSHGCGECLEESGRGGIDGYGRRGLGSRGGMKVGWGRQGAVRLDDPPLRHARDEMDDGLGSLGALGRMGGLGGQGGIDPFGRRGGMDTFGGLNGMGGLGGIGGLGGMGGRDYPSGPTMARNPLGSPRSPMFNGQPPFAENAMLGLHQRNLFHSEAGMGSPLQDRFMGARQGLMDPLGIGMRSTSLRSGGSFDMRAMDRPRMSYAPLQGSPFQLQNQHPNYRPPYVEDYEGSEMEAELAAHQAAMQMQMMHGRGGGNPFFFDGQYEDGYGGMALMMSEGSGSPMPGMGGIH